MLETQRFYVAHAAEFDATRQGAWASWTRLGRFVTGSVLDLGCGNGRFLQFLYQTGVVFDAYLGVDSNAELLSRAKASITSTPTCDFLECTLEEEIMKPTLYNTIVLFGVMHHLPDTKYRKDVMKQLALKLKPGGKLLVSFWQPQHLPTFSNKIAQNHHGFVLEENDYLLGWNGNFSTVRYCHHFTQSDIDELARASGCATIERFAGEGNDRTNQYVVLEQRAD